jgi:hypothetical protein
MHNAESVTIILPIPAKVLQPNHSVGSFGMRMAVASARKRLRRLAREAIEEETVETAPWKKCSVRAVFHVATNRKRDDDNAIGSLKSAYDGIVDAGLVLNDDHASMSREGPEFIVDKVNQFVILEINRIE